MRSLLCLDSTGHQEVFQQPLPEESHPLAPADVSYSPGPGQILQRTARVCAAQELDRFIEREQDESIHTIASHRSGDVFPVRVWLFRHVAGSSCNCDSFVSNPIHARMKTRLQDHRL